MSRNSARAPSRTSKRVLQESINCLQSIPGIRDIKASVDARSLAIISKLLKPMLKNPGGRAPPSKKLLAEVAEALMNGPIEVRKPWSKSTLAKGILEWINVATGLENKDQQQRLFIRFKQSGDRPQDAKAKVYFAESGPASATLPSVEEVNTAVASTGNQAASQRTPHLGRNQRPPPLASATAIPTASLITTDGAALAQILTTPEIPSNLAATRLPTNNANLSARVGPPDNVRGVVTNSEAATIPAPTNSVREVRKWFSDDGQN